MKHDLEELLKHALSSKEEPNDWLNQRLLQRIQEKEYEAMRKNNKMIKIPAAVLTALMILFIGSASVYAAWKYLTPGQVAELADDQGLAAAFQSGDAIAVNEIQTYGKYQITLLGIVSGENLSQYVVEDDGDIRKDRTYVVTAIENTDGTKRPDTSEDAYGEDPFFVSPLIQGLDPANHNIVTMGGGYSEIVEDGIQYRITECSNVEIFADRQVYLCVNDGVFYRQEAYQYEKGSGNIIRNKSYQGVNALFTLPLDQEKADRQAAEEYLNSLKEEDSEEDTQENIEYDFLSKVSKEIQEWGIADFNEKTSLIKELQVTPDEEGNFSYEYSIHEDGAGSAGTITALAIKDRQEDGLAKMRLVMDGRESNTAYIETYTLQEDGTLLLRLYLYQA